MLNEMKPTLLLTTLAVWLTAFSLMAAPAKPNPFQHVHSDGSTVTLVMGGGEFLHSLMTLDGLTVSQDENGDYCYLANGMLSTMKAHDPQARGLEEQAFVLAYRDQMTLESRARNRRAPSRTDETPATTQVPTTGSPRIPIILVNYTDVHFIGSDPVATFQNQFNEMPYSCLHYFESQSRGRFSPQFDILGPVQLSQDRAYYGGNIRIYGQDCDKQLGTMIYEACQGLPQVDFSVYDNDGDSCVDVVVVLYAGVGEAQAYSRVPESVWPCQWNMTEAYDWNCSTTGPFQLNGVTIDKFAVFNELEGSSNASTTIDGVGTFCHEFSHCLGLPDFYPTNGSSAFGMGVWDIMDRGCYLDGGNRPAGYTSYERHFMGWMDLIDPVENTRYVLPPLNSEGGTAVKVTNDAFTDEYYLLEYRHKSGWDEFLPTEGLMILHVDYNKYAWDNNTPNNMSNHQRMSLIPADNSLTNTTTKGDLWPRGSLDSLTNLSVPAAKVFVGDFMNKPITAMRIADDRSAASFWYMKKEQTWPAGDVNHDGEVNISDVNCLIDVILDVELQPDCDVNADGEIDIADINALIDLILSGY